MTYEQFCWKMEKLGWNENQCDEIINRWKKKMTILHNSGKVDFIKDKDKATEDFYIQTIRGKDTNRIVQEWLDFHDLADELIQCLKDNRGEEI